MLVKKYLATIVSITNPFDGLYTLEFKSLGGKFKYHPGQFLHLAIDSEYDGIDQWPDSRCFSMQSNPSEDIIRITYAVKGRFTKLMENQLKIGDNIWLKLPYGDLFTQPHSKNNTVFIAGGTGITPFLSLFTHESFFVYNNPRIYLGFKSKTFNIYDVELKQLIHCSPKIYYNDIDGPLDIQNIYDENGSNCDYFISGPPEMIKNFKQELIKSGVSSRHVLTDDWE